MVLFLESLVGIRFTPSSQKKIFAVLAMTLSFAFLSAEPAQALCPAWSCSTSYAVGAKASHGGLDFTLTAAARAASCPGYTPPTDNWWTQTGSCSGATPTSTTAGATPTATNTPRPGATATNTARPTATATSGGGTGISSIVSSTQFNSIWPTNRHAYYVHSEFVSGAANYPALCATGDANEKKRECAAYFANKSQETGQGKLIRECYCQPASSTECAYINGAGADGAGYPSAACDYKTTAWGDQSCGGGAAGQRYFGRGPIQLSWNPNYCGAQAAIGGSPNIYADPNGIFSDRVRMWKLANWYWMTNPGPAVSNSIGSWPTENAHDTITGACANGSLCGFANTIRAINGTIECPYSGRPAQQTARVNYYNGSGGDEEDSSGGTLGVLGYGGGLYGRRFCSN